MEDLVAKWEQNRMCNELIFNFGELSEMFWKLGMNFALRRSDQILQRANKDRNDEFDVEDFVTIYKLEVKKNRATRRNIAE